MCNFKVKKYGGNGARKKQQSNICLEIAKINGAISYSAKDKG